MSTLTLLIQFGGSHFSVTLRRKEAGSLPSLIECIKKSYMPEPTFDVLEEIVDMRRFIMG